MTFEASRLKQSATGSGELKQSAIRAPEGNGETLLKTTQRQTLSLGAEAVAGKSLNAEILPSDSLELSPGGPILRAARTANTAAGSEGPGNSLQMPDQCDPLSCLWEANGRLLQSGVTPTKIVPDAQAAKREFLALAKRWSGQYLDLPTCQDNQWGPEGLAARRHVGNEPRIIVSGHQPELFHPGVWFKNFVLDRAADRLGAIAINLIVDNDLVKSNGLKFPVLQGERLVSKRLNFDYFGLGIPFEERQVYEFDLLRSLPSRLAAVLLDGGYHPLLQSIWPDVAKYSLQLKRLGYGFAAARHCLESRAGVQNLEVPLSLLCETNSFHHFFVSILDRSEDFVFHYNSVLDDYRQINLIRGQNRPVPDLQRVDDWFELPFWIWTKASPQRKRLFARRLSGEGSLGVWHLSDGPGRTQAKPTVELRLDSGDVFDQLDSLKGQGIRLRTRALTTTMYCRGALSQMFVHGIGGAIYDQITDEIVRRFWNVELPGFVTTTATLHLDAAGSNAFGLDAIAKSKPQSIADMKQMRRQLLYAPELFSQSATAKDLGQRKSRLLKEIPVPGHKKKWHDELVSINWKLRTSLHEQLSQLDQQIQECKLQRDNQKLSKSREWSFVLFSEALPEKLKQMARSAISKLSNEPKRLVKSTSRSTVV